MLGRTFEGYIHARSPKAVLFQGHYWEDGTWLPLSQIEVKEDENSHVVVVKEWLCAKNNLAEFEHIPTGAFGEWGVSFGGENA